jgi:DNA-binding Lrp family transcriptional regulator
MWNWIDLTSSIMREMASSPSHWNVRRSYTEVARKLGVDEETVRNRLHMMKEMGLLQGWRLIVNAGLLGLQSSNLVLEFASPETKEAAIPAIRKTDGVILLQNFYGDSLQVTVFHGQGDGGDLGNMHLRQIGDTSGGRLVTLWKVDLPRCEVKLKEMDWRIIGLLLRNAERKFPEIARELKASTRTVKRRMNLLMASSALFMQPVLDLRKASGVTPCQLLIECSPERKRAIDESVGSKFERIVFRLTNSGTHSIFTILCTNVGETKEILKWAREQEGVRMAKTDILENQEYVYEWLEREVAGHTRGSHRSRRVKSEKLPGRNTGGPELSAS